jgi:hypothetical protein
METLKLWELHALLFVVVADFSGCFILDGRVYDMSVAWCLG